MAGRASPERRQQGGEAEEPLELLALLGGSERRVVEVLMAPAASTPVAWSFAPAFGEIHTSVQAGGMARPRMRASASSFVIARPRESP
jgi:hypothetical protein